ncbi:MAG: hypothetical protein MJA83_04795, partial [Gammaproteobacteria bacterium]|nr:hypothetical protein [Gammaproteobacteria bacterium]
RGSQIGYIHRSAAARDRLFELVAGAFDVKPERGRDFGMLRPENLKEGPMIDNQVLLFAGVAALFDRR